ncbi:MAG: hypothetical protein IKL08_01790 [Clostridia bacterium]|nr:hypothetical protein [Clostridia bacterium]
MDNQKLYHSDIYLGQEYSDGIKHYKYLKKIKTNSGKWRYIYDETELKKAQGEIDALKKARGMMLNKNGALEYINKDGNYVAKFPSGSSTTIYGKNKQTTADKYKEKLDNTINKKEHAYATQKLKDVPKRVISRGISFVYDMLNIKSTFKKKWVR